MLTPTASLVPFAASLPPAVAAVVAVAAVAAVADAVADAWRSSALMGVRLEPYSITLVYAAARQRM
eukprot:CAMPEP_0205914594 /NCGR_PEP_ID=MMETSP1325-20131115/7319_1 /ASSEMBLY_ACC=CAM_ASM_000708 /TAXON_ID=236786 /ORGANISM="Florenciella sp., Strain RCC1007" /LENGTH=65 /DNA_ID=CAMNT_0053281651 /DNA_START=208 /DNA_END=405 /DNA_ORIENTATION=-